MQQRTRNRPLSAWLTRKGIRFFAIPNGGYRDAREAAKFRRCGVQPGVPDLCVPIPSGSYHGLYIELKRATGGRISEYQVEWIKYLRDKGYWADIANGFEEARKMVEQYLALTPKAA